MILRGSAVALHTSDQVRLVSQLIWVLMQQVLQTALINGTIFSFCYTYCIVMLTEYLLYSYVLNVCVHSCDMNTCVWCRIAHQDPIMVHCHRRRNAALCCHVLNAQCCRHLCSHLLCHLQLPWIDSIRLMRSVKPYYIVCHSTDNSILPQAGVQSIMLSMSVCLTARITRNRLTGLYQIFVHVACGYVSVLL